MGSGLVFCFRGSQTLTLSAQVMYVANHKKRMSKVKNQDLTPTGQNQKVIPDLYMHDPHMLLTS